MTKKNQPKVPKFPPGMLGCPIGMFRLFCFIDFTFFSQVQNKINRDLHVRLGYL